MSRLKKMIIAVWENETMTDKGMDILIGYMIGADIVMAVFIIASIVYLVVTAIRGY